MHLERLGRESAGGGCGVGVRTMMSRMDAEVYGLHSSGWVGGRSWWAGRRLAVVAEVGHPDTRVGAMVSGRRVGNILCCSLVEVQFPAERGHTPVAVGFEVDRACVGRRPCG